MFGGISILLSIRVIYIPTYSANGSLSPLLQPSFFSVFLLVIILMGLRRCFIVVLICTSPAINGVQFFCAFVCVLYVLLERFLLRCFASCFFFFFLLLVEWTYKFPIFTPNQCIVWKSSHGGFLTLIVCCAETFRLSLLFVLWKSDPRNPSPDYCWSHFPLNFLSDA